jgi:hypothetical protein
MYYSKILLNDIPRKNRHSNKIPSLRFITLLLKSLMGHTLRQMHSVHNSDAKISYFCLSFQRVGHVLKNLRPDVTICTLGRGVVSFEPNTHAHLQNSNIRNCLFNTFSVIFHIWRISILS